LLVGIRGKSPFHLNPSGRRLALTDPHSHGGIFRAPMPVISLAIKIEQKKQMPLNTKQDCIDSIVQYLERAAAWRRTLAVKFEDVRNTRAASLAALLGKSGFRRAVGNAFGPQDWPSCYREVIDIP
jgi:hypothetical protein